MQSVYIDTYGCTLNHADSDIIASRLQGHYSLSDSIESADIVIMNTCTVKKGTEQKILYKLGMLEKEHRRVIVSGCMAGANRDIIKKRAPNAGIVTIQNVDRICEALDEICRGIVPNITGAKSSDRISMLSPTKRILSRIPISDGCVSSCSFCETKFARGPLRSFNEEAILKAIKNSVESGAKEVQITSQDIGSYGFDKKTDIADLLEKIERIDGDFKVRIGMLNPQHMHRYMERLCDIMKSERFYRFLHLPVQTGSDKVLKDMKREYSIEEFKGQINYIRKHLSKVGIETDIIVGFPTEEEIDFEMSCELVENMRFEVTNISRFGARPHASASNMLQLGYDVINKRSNVMSRLVRSVQNDINRHYINSSVDALFTERTDVSVNGRNESYRQVVVKDASESILGTHSKVRINAVSANAIYGEIEVI